MLRRIARVLQVVFLIVGTAVLLWLPVSFFVWVIVITTTPEPRALCRCTNGAVFLMWFGDYPQVRNPLSDAVFPWTEPGIYVERAKSDRQDTMDAAMPRMNSSGIPGVTSITTTVSIPLWLLAAVFLAWPGTSLLLARRRRKGRGFAVEPAANAAPPAIDPHHPSNLPPP